MNTFTKFAASVSASLVILGAGVAHAEDSKDVDNVDSPPSKTTEVAQVSGTISTDGGAGAGGGTDHSRFVGTFGIGYMGFRQMSLGTIANTVQAPVIGMRYWLDDFMGIDAGLGFSTGGGTNEVEVMGMTTETDAAAPTTFILHGGLPLALADSEHFVFQIVPELNFGLSSMTTEMDPDDTDESGMHFDIGARAGAEIHFGFIDIPQLALQAGVGLKLAFDSVSTETGPAKASQSRNSLSTGVGDNPWNIFAANVAALYYFDR